MARKRMPKKVYTPGSQPAGCAAKSPGRGRPKKVMVRCGTSRAGNYRSKYSKEQLESAIRTYKAGKMSLSEVSKQFNVPTSTLCDRINKKVKGTLGRPTVLSREEEEILVERLIMHGEWGFPLTSEDVRTVIKDYLDRLGRNTRNVKKHKKIQYQYQMIVPGTSSGS